MLVPRTWDDTKMVPVAPCQGKMKRHVWNLAWGDALVVRMRPQSRAHDGGLRRPDCSGPLSRSATLGSKH